MAAASIVYDWLDRWEQGHAAGGPADPTEFAREHCRDAPQDLIDAFLQKARVLLSINADLRRFGSAPTPGGVAGATDARAEAQLAPGGEPLPNYRPNTASAEVESGRCGGPPPRTGGRWR